jgi:hypothetical protein
VLKEEGEEERHDKIDTFATKEIMRWGIRTTEILLRDNISSKDGANNPNRDH